jgi:hypothetical protein
MKQFLLYTLKILLFTIVIAVVLDFGYTKVFLQSTNRGKIEKVFNSKDEKYDVVNFRVIKSEQSFCGANV